MLYEVITGRADENYSRAAPRRADHPPGPAVAAPRHGPGVHVLRITSYNVCYTKLLRGELKRKADKDPEDYALFWNNFGAVLKEGLYEDESQRGAILELARFQTVITSYSIHYTKLYDPSRRSGSGCP